MSRTKSEKSERFFEKAKKANNNNNNKNNNNNNINIKEEVNNDNDADANDLAARGMVSLSAKAPPPPPKREEVLCRAEELGIPRSYAEARLERAEHFSRYEKRSEVDILQEWWEGDRRGTPKNVLLSSKKEKSYDLDEFFQAALAHSYADIEAG